MSLECEIKKSTIPLSSSTVITTTKTTKKTKRLESGQRTKGQAGRTEEVKYIKQIKNTREQRKHDTQIKIRDAANVKEILSVATVNNDDRNQDNEDSDSYLSETDSYCRHCLRPQSELQLRYMRPRQRSKLRQQQHVKRDRSKQRFSSYCMGSSSGNANMSSVASQAQKTRSKKSRSKSRAKRARNTKHPNVNNSNNKENNSKEQHIKLPLIRDLNAANEQAIRFRCPQVGPQVGRDRQMPPTLHFHHPQHIQKQLTAYQVQHTQGQQIISPMQTTTLTMESELKQQQQHHYHHHQHHHHHHNHYCHQHNEHLSNNQKSNKNQKQLVTSAKDLSAANTKTTITVAHDLQNCCSSIHQQNQQTTHHHSHPCNSDYEKQQNCCKTGTTTITCCCSCIAKETTTENWHRQDYHRNHDPLHQQHHNLPQLPLTRLETDATTAVASLDATTLVVTATTTTTTCNNTTILTQVSASQSLPLADEHGISNLNNPTTTEEEPSNLATATTPDSPSLVKIRISKTKKCCNQLMAIG